MKKMFSVLIAAITIFCSVFVASNINNITADESYATTYSVQDMVNLQKFILSELKGEDILDKKYDLNNDGTCNIFDICLMKWRLLNNQNIENNDEVDYLVAYFSRTGNTEKIANHIVNITNADKYEIEAKISYTDEDIQYTNSSCRANQEQNDKTVRPEIAQSIENIDTYEVIFLGYPIWWGEEPRIIDTFLESYDFSDKIIVPFCTSGSSSIKTSENNIKNLGISIDTQMSGRRFSSNATESEVASWIETLDLPTNKEETEAKLNIKIGENLLTATLEDNSSAKALIELLDFEPLTITLNDYANFEKVGTLLENLPRNDEQLDTDFGDIILYQGNKFVIYYDKNSWSFTKLGHIDNITKEELKNILGDDSVEVTLSILK
ncbi:MAG: hypothetical protein IJZ64_07295 [Ruminococcus sp.]|nr:hypothetical protein [Ruminococcus sp.]